MIKLYDRLLNRCQTINQVNSVNIALANKLTVLELYELHQEFRLKFLRDVEVLHPNKIKLKLHGLREVEKIIDLTNKSGKKHQEPFIRRRVKKNIQMFSHFGLKKEKTLIIAFAGNANRLMMPIPVFLQHISADKYDILLLNDPSKNGYRNGLPSVSDDFESLMVEINSLIDKSEYKSVISLGTSAGGLPAIWTALYLQVDKGISIGGSGPSHPAWQQVRNNASEDLTNLFNQSSTSNILYICGNDFERDVSSSRELSNIIQIQTLTVCGTTKNMNIGHNPLMPILKKSMLASFFDVILDPGIIGYDNKLLGSSKLWI
ncbi:hypothetical protein [Pseudoalteromonas sp.]|uniref:hypothetical protein n=1 Tax=Pseudoalteromonas sp. TaxID=53249 RepID=UPI0030024D27